MQRSSVGLLLRSTQAFCSQICEKETLRYGIAYYSRRFATLPEANQFREVVVEDPAKLPEAFEEAERWFRERDLFCYRWAPAAGQTGEELAGFLLAQGFRKRTFTAMCLTKWVDIETPDDVRVLPARAMRAAFQNTFLNTDSPPSPVIRELRAQAYVQRLDDPQFDMFVAVVDREPVGRCALYQVGETARVMDLTVLAGFASRGVESALTAHVLTLAKRLAMRNICLLIGDDDPAGRGWFESVGFVADGVITEFERTPPRSPPWKGGMEGGAHGNPP